MSAKQTPLPDLLDRVPDDIVLGIPGDEPMFPSYTNIPIGKLAQEAAAELRRLHAEVERLSWDSIHTCHAECQRPLCKLTRERDALRQIVQDFPPVEAELREVSDRAHRLEALRDALLEALHAMLSHTAMLDPMQGYDGFDHSAVNQARAAIKAVEGENHAKNL